MAGTFGFLLIAFLVLYLEISQQPSNGSQQKTESGQHQKKSAKSKQGTPDNPVVVQIAGQHQVEAEQARKEHNYKSPEWNTVYITIFLTAFTLGLMIFTAMLWAVTTQLMERSDKTIKTIERAYVQPSHLSNEIPGLHIDRAGACRIQIQIKNHGTTPARITRAFFTHRVLPSDEQLPDIPEYVRPDDSEAEEPAIEAFLMKDAYVNIGFQFTMPMTTPPHLNSGEWILYIYGFVDYTDVFDRHFRSGYGRQYAPNLPHNNLVFIRQPRYNYDCERENDTCKGWPAQRGGNPA